MAETTFRDGKRPFIREISRNHDHFTLMSSSKFARISLTFLQMLFSPKSQRDRSEASEELSYYGSVQVCVLQNVFVSLPPPLVVLRQRVSSPAYLSVLYSRPPQRQRTRVYYSLQ